jgi:hypothetical protein
VNRVSLIGSFFDATSGWGWNGFGNPRPYFSGCAFVILRALAIDVLGPFAAFAALMFLVGAVVAYAGDAMASLITSKPLVRACAAAFALFNPWVYAKIVAGHYPMVLSCAALALILREAMLPRPRALRVALIVAVLLPQLQFFLLAIPLLLYLAIRKRCYLPVVTAAIVSLPIWIGVAFESRYLAGIPYTLEWQNIQSVAPKDALLLLGYFPGYLHAIAWVAYPMLAILLMAAVGTELRASTNRRLSWWVVGVALFLLAAMGTRSPLAPLMTSVFAGQHLSAVFRELYDLLGVVAIAYGFYAAAAADRWRAVAILFAAANLGLMAAWAAVPPSSYWVDARALPRASVKAPANVRIALSPAIQPLSFEGYGSGADPDASAALGTDAHIVNEYLPSYPVNAALAQFSHGGDVSGLAGLSVGAIVYRPWLQTGALVLDPATNARARKVSAIRGSAGVAVVTNAVPLLSLAGLPAVGSLNRRIGTGAIFFGDAGERVRSIDAPTITADPARGWTSVDLMAARHPEVAQGIGGAATVSTLPLAAQTDAWTLVYVRGRLSGSSTPVSNVRGAFSWVATVPGAHTFTCAGVCAVIATTAQRPHWPLEPRAAQNYGALAYAAPTPWLLETAVPAFAQPELLRFNMRFDPHWMAVGNAGVHLRIDAAVNGWTLPPSVTGRRIVLVESVAAIQFVFATIGLLWTLALFGMWLAGTIAARHSPRGDLLPACPDEAHIENPPIADRT